MIPQTLLAEATRYGIQLYADGQTISYRGPKSTVAELKPKFAAQRAKYSPCFVPNAKRQKLVACLSKMIGYPCRPAAISHTRSLRVCQGYGVAIRIDALTGV